MNKPTDVVVMLRGHPIYQDNDGVFRYCDNNEPTETTWFNRPCGHCGMSGNSNDGLPDPCLRYLAGVTNACCGHGDPTQAYIVFAGGVVIRGFTVEIDDRREINSEEHDLILEHNKARRKFYKLPGEGQ